MIIAEQVAILLVFIIVGYLLKKADVIPENGATILSKMLFYVFVPAMNFQTFSQRLTMENLYEQTEVIFYSIVILLLTVLGGKLLGKLFSKDSYEQGVYAYTFISPNFGYAGYALMAAVGGDAMLLQMMIFTFAMTIYINTEGYRVLSGAERVSLRASITPGIIAILLGAGCGLASIQLPNFCIEAVSKAAGCMAPVSMLLTGLVIAEFPLKEILFRKKTYLVTALRLVGIPALLCGILTMLHTDQNIIMICLLTYAMPCGLNPIIYPKLVGRDCRTGASFALVSAIFSIVTLPLLMAIFIK